ncbi:glycosyltransferase family 4 protein [Paenibacillus validus]|uniref:glycosyltransferase family 4 protein n=1 Tax=Paenibacillus validus TaxID=44253 RepID=UPI000FD89436|nr:glycosyltransferase family 4 protein [Paenibacillus validus]MED4601681.1 glycosyltransferase family 4 protein [Paenibacillus validus]MED4606208.1 glycosyltransferase family 4 protein [Paenibacillus validus]
MSRMNILATGMGWPTYQAGGLNTYFRSICNKLSEVHEIDALISSPEKPQNHNRLRIIQATSPDKAMLLRQRDFKRKASEIMKAKPIHLLYSHFSPYALGPALEAKQRRIPIVISFHGPWANERSIESHSSVARLKVAMARKIEESVYRLGDRFIVLSQYFKDILHEEFNVPNEKIKIVPGATDVMKYKPVTDNLMKNMIREQLNIPRDSVIVLTVRRLMRRMGLVQLVEAWKEVIHTVPNGVLLIGGRGPLAEELSQKIMEYGLENHVRLLGYVPEDQITLYYQSADLFVVPTQALEGFGLITIESLASGVPVAATPIGGNKEILSAFDKRFLFDDISSGAIASGLIRLLRERNDWPSAEICRDHVLAGYTWNKVADQVDSILNETVKYKKFELEGALL